MITAEQIPPDAMYAAWKALNAGMTINDAIAAAINAWPGAWHVDAADFEDKLILPLTHESST